MPPCNPPTTSPTAASPSLSPNPASPPLLANPTAVIPSVARNLSSFHSAQPSISTTSLPPNSPSSTNVVPARSYRLSPHHLPAFSKLRDNITWRRASSARAPAPVRSASNLTSSRRSIFPSSPYPTPRPI